MNIKKEIRSAVTEMLRNKDTASGTYVWYLDKNNNGYDWAIVLGWSAGFEPNEDDYVDSFGYRLAIKLAYQSSKSIMQCDYDVDWLFPYDDEAMECIDTEMTLTPGTDTNEIVDRLTYLYEKEFRQ